MTNADKYFRQASDEELSLRLSIIHEHWFPFAKIWDQKNWLDWLKQEVSE